MTVQALQAKLGVTEDGVFGPATFGPVLDRIGQPGARRDALAAAFAHHLPESDITSRLRTIHFLAQAAHETGGFHFFTELGGPGYLARYDGRADLGNTQPGDGARYCGRGIFQLTGRANYRTYGQALDLDLIANPGQAAEPDAAVRVACLFWTRHGLNALADADDCEAITRKINGGTNGLLERCSLVAKLQELWPAP